MKRRFLTCLALWAAITMLAMALHFCVRQRGGAHGPITDSLVPIASALHFVSIPVRSTLRRLELAEHLPPLAMSAVAAGIGWLGVLAVFAAANEARLVLVRFKPERAALAGAPIMPGVDLARRRFLINAGCGAAAFGATGAGAKAAIVDPGDIVLRRYSIPIRGLPAALDGLRLVQISDTHLGPAVSATHVRSAVHLALRQRPDLVVLTGDYIEAGNSYIEQAAGLFAPLLARGGPRLGVLGVLGNHDFYGDAARVRSALERVGVRMIDNSRLFLDSSARSWSVSAPREAVCFAGLGDLDEDATDPASAFRNIPSDMPRILLCHQPDTVELPDVRRERIDLALCGHTHGGQISLPLLGTPVIPSRYGRKYSGGLVKGPTGPVVVSRGVGMSILPIRWNVPPEVVLVTLARSG